MPLYGPDKSVPETVNSSPFLPLPSLISHSSSGFLDTGADALKCLKSKDDSVAQCFPLKPQLPIPQRVRAVTE